MRYLVVATVLAVAACGGGSHVVAPDLLPPEVELKQIGVRSVGLTGGTLDANWSAMDRNVFACDASGYCTNVICRPGDASCIPGRNGYWMCGRVSASEGIVQPFTSPSGGYTLKQGSVPLSAVERKPLCQNASDCNMGYRVW